MIQHNHRHYLNHQHPPTAPPPLPPPPTLPAEIKASPNLLRYNPLIISLVPFFQCQSGPGSSIAMDPLPLTGWTTVLPRFKMQPNSRRIHLLILRPRHLRIHLLILRPRHLRSPRRVGRPRGQPPVRVWTALRTAMKPTLTVAGSRAKGV